MKRDKLFDSLKYILMFLVVYGHVIQKYRDSQVNMAIYNFIYMFHMPLFIFISGLFSQIRNRHKYKNKIIKLFESYIVFQIVHSLLGHESIYELIIMPNGALWYLLSLFFWRLIIYFTPPRLLFCCKKQILVLSIMVSVFSGFIPVGTQFSFQRTLALSPFFFLGYFSNGIDIRNIISRFPLILSILFLLCSFMLLFEINISLNYMHHCNTPYWNDSLIITFYRFGARCLYLPVAFVFGFMVIRFFVNKPIFAKLGSTTLFILVFHSYAINVLNIMINKKIVFSNEFVLLISAIGITLILSFVGRFKFILYILNPISFCCKKLSIH